MPQYVLECQDCKNVIDKICSYEKAKTNKCEKCGSENSKIIPSRGIFKIYGYAEWNNYSRDESHYDPSMNK